MARGQVLVITPDSALLREMSPSLLSRKYELVAMSSVQDAVVRIAGEDFAGVVADFSRISAADRETLLKAHKQRANFSLFLLETLATISPTEDFPLRRVSWPLQPGFVDQVRSVQKPVVFLVDQSLFAGAALQTALQQAGVQTTSLDSPKTLSEVLMRTPAPRPLTQSRPKSFWAKLSGEADADTEPTAPLGNVVIVLFQGSLADAEALDARLRQSSPSVVCYKVSGIDPAGDAVQALRARFPAVLMREQAGLVGAVLAESAQAVGQRTQRPRILLCDNNKAVMEAFTQVLVPNGYEVVSIADGKECLDRTAQPGAFQLVVLGLPLAFVQNSSLEVAKKLRERDEHLAVVLMIEPHPMPTAIQAVSEASTLRLDAALIKPVTPSQLLSSIRKALKERFLVQENERLLKETTEQKAQLEQINGFQKKFFAMVAHDVKNPLTAILGYAEVLGMRLKDLPNELKCASHIHSAAKTLNLLISDLVDLAAIESGKLRVNIGTMDLAQVVTEVKSRVDVFAQQRKITFGAIVPGGIPPLAGDPARIGQVIQNLSTNGIQYTKEGGSVTVRVDLAPDWVTVSVIDTGIGIKKEDLPRVWERFFQTQEAQAMRKAGFGLGLKISREIVQMHGGEIGIESEYGKGSRFYFTLPVPKPGQTISPAAPAAPAAAPVPPAAPATPTPRQVPAGPSPLMRPSTPLPTPVPTPPQPPKTDK